MAEEVVDGVARLVGHGTGRTKQIIEIGQGLFGAVVAEREEQVFLGGEVGVDGADGQARFANDVIHGRGVIALAGETGHRGSEDLGAPLLFVDERNLGHVGAGLLSRASFPKRKTSARFVNYGTPARVRQAQLANQLTPALAFRRTAPGLSCSARRRRTWQPRSQNRTAGL